MKSTQENSLDCSSIVFRALIRSREYDKRLNKPASGAFLLREEESGLSVDIRSIRPLEETIKQFRNVFAVISWHTGGVRNIRWGEELSGERSLDVVAIPLEVNPAHAEVRGLPHPTNELAEAEYVSGLLAAQARLAWTPEEIPRH